MRFDAETIARLRRVLGRPQAPWPPRLAGLLGQALDEIARLREELAGQFFTSPRPWRTGLQVGRTIYDANDRLIGTMDTRQDAALAVRAVNSMCELCGKDDDGCYCASDSDLPGAP